MSENGFSSGTHVRPWVGVARLESLLGHSLQLIGWDTAERIVERRLPEDQSLEFKREPYDSSDKSKHELCKDIAGMANAGGGLIVVGIAEDANNSAESIRPVVNAGDEVTRMNQVVLSSIEPMIQDLAIWEGVNPAGEEHVLFIVVPDSYSTPHAVRRGDAYGWPVRHDRATRWMRESEIGTFYRERFRTGEDVVARVAEVHRSGIEALDQVGNCWIAISCSPRRSGHLPADRDLYRQWLADAMDSMPFGISTSIAVLGRRRIVFTDQFPYTGRSRDHHVVLHSDGSAFGGVVVNLRGPGIDPQRTPLGDHVELDTDSLMHVVPSMLAVFARHAANCGGGGDLSVVAQLVGAFPDQSQARISHGKVPLVATEPYTDSSGAYFGPRMVPGSMPVTEPTALEATLPISIGYDLSHLIEGAAEVCHELIAEFGASVSEPVLLLNGRVRERAFPCALDPLFGWARLNQLLSD